MTQTSGASPASAAPPSARLAAIVDASGLPPLEAMHAGTPVLASALPSTQGAALEVDPLDVAAIADGMLRLAGDDELRRRVTAQGTERAAALTWRASAGAHLEVWRAVSGAVR